MQSKNMIIYIESTSVVILNMAKLFGSRTGTMIYDIYESPVGPSHFPLPTSHFLLPTSHFLLPTSLFKSPVGTSYFLLLT